MDLRGKPIYRPRKVERAPSRSALGVRKSVDQASNHTSFNEVKSPARTRRMVSIRLPKITLKLPLGYKQYAERFGLTLFTVILAFALVVLPSVTLSVNDKRYQLNSKTLELTGDISQKLVQKLNYDSKNQAFQFNQDYKPEPNTVSITAGKYQATLAEDYATGVSVKDPVSKTELKLVPQFKTSQGKSVENRIVYPVNGRDAQLVYTVKGNGLKEDIILNKFQGEDISFEYKIDLPDGLEARLLAGGSIGVFGSELNLLGDVSVSNEKDKKLLSSARKNAKKEHLLYEIPAPVVKETGKELSKVESKFNLSGNDLTIETKGLGQASYPLSIDPSVIVTSADDFTAGITENVEIDAANHQIKRSGLTSGVIGSWTNDGGNFTVRVYHATVISRGYIYAIGGCITITAMSCQALTGNVQKASIAGGTLGSWSATTSLQTARYAHSAAEYDGYIYVMSGCVTTGCSGTSSIERGKVESNGDILSWVGDTAGFTLADAKAVAYEGYIYTVGGSGSAVNVSAVNMTKIKPDHTLSTWVTTTSLPEVLSRVGVAVYDGHIYSVGGCSGVSSDCAATTDKIYLGKINSANGQIISWSQSAIGSPLAGFGMGVAAVKNHLYVSGGAPSSTGSSITTVYFAEIYPDGIISGFRGTNPMPAARDSHSLVASSDRLFVVGGRTSTGAAATLPTTNQQAIINVVGATHPWLTDAGTSFTTPRTNLSATVYNGYLYVVGGLTTALILSDVQYAPLNDDGSVGTWAATTAMIATEGATAGRERHAIVAADGYLYVVGGRSQTILLADVYHSDILYAPLDATTGAVGGWTQNTSMLLNARMEAAVAVYNGYMYVTGGKTDVTTYATILYAPIVYATSGNGSLGSFSTTTTNPGVQIRGHSAVAYGGRLYIAGGSNGGNTTQYRSVYFASIDTSTGNITSAWTTNSLVIPTTAAYKASFSIIKGVAYYYAVDDFATTLWAAVIDANGGFPSFNAVGNIASGVARSAAVQYGNNIYAVGGCTANNGGAAGTDCTGFSNAVQYGNVSHGGPGTLAPPSTGTNLITARKFHTTVYSGGKIWVIGGCTDAACTGSTYTATTEYATVNSNGSLSGWTSGPSLNTARGFYASVVLNGYVYAIAGLTAPSLVATNSVEYAKFNADGTLSGNSCGTSVTWCTTTNYPEANYVHGATTYNGYGYVIGGGTSMTKVRYFKPASDGTITSWLTTTDLPVSRNWVAATAYNGYLYVMGGCITVSCADTDTPNLRNTALYAPINADGSVGSWNYTNSFHGHRRGASAEAVNGYMYIIGGDKPSAINSPGTQYAAILPNGHLGTWKKTKDLSPNTLFNSTVRVNNRIYRVGGSASMSTSWYSDILAMPRYGRFTKIVDLGTVVTPRGFVANGGARNMSLSHRYSTGSSVTPANALAYMFSMGIPRQIAEDQGRYQYLKLEFNDEDTTVFPDTLSTAGTLTDLELFYSPNVGQRLRNGKTFTNEAPQGLETTPTFGQ